MLRWQKLRLEASCSLFIRPSVCTSHTRTQHICFRKRIARPCWGNSSIFSPPPPWQEEPGQLWPLTDASLVPRQLHRMDGSRRAIYPPVGAPYHSLSEAWDKVLLCLRFCRSVLLQGGEKRHRCSCYATKVAGWKCFIGRPRRWRPALMENFGTEVFLPLVCGPQLPKSQRDGKQHK